jgi:hypothetical protein
MTRLISLFGGGPIPMPEKRYVIGVDHPRRMEITQAQAFEHHLVFCAQLCQLPGTPFTNRFRYVEAD